MIYSRLLPLFTGHSSIDMIRCLKEKDETRLTEVIIEHFGTFQQRLGTHKQRTAGSRTVAVGRNSQSVSRALMGRVDEEEPS